MARALIVSAEAPGARETNFRLARIFLWSTTDLMNDNSDIFYLETLVEALDRRRPQPDRPEAERIARAGAVLRRQALHRLAELGGERRAGQCRP